MQLSVDAELRRGIQPIVTLAVARTSDASSHPTALVKKGRNVTFWARAQTPPSAGKIVRVEWDFEGDGHFTAPPVSIDHEFAFKEVHRFDRPGTYFPVVRVTAQRDGDANTSFGLVQNLASMRVTVR